jgi:hypothetical protein
MITAGDHAPRRWIWDSVQNNPHIIAHYLIRLTAFKKPVHEHGIYWIPDPPDEVQRDLITIDSEEITAQRSVTDLRIPEIGMRLTMDSSPLPLNSEQRKLYDTAVDQYSRELAPPLLLLNVDDVAGSGQIFRLKTCARLQELAEQVGRQSPVFRAAPTGIATFNILGRILHSLLKLLVKAKKSDLSFYFAAISSNFPP